MKVLRFFNRQKARPLRVAGLRVVTRFLLEEVMEIQAFEFAVHLVEAEEMARVNGTFLGHEGSTDVITFDNSEPGSEGALMGELFISVDDAIGYAKTFRTTWESEVVRYIVHGVLHLRGYDDLQPALRRVMKREENRLVKLLATQFNFADLGTRATPEKLSS